MKVNMCTFDSPCTHMYACLQATGNSSGSVAAGSHAGSPPPPAKSAAGKAQKTAALAALYKKSNSIPDYIRCSHKGKEGDRDSRRGGAAGGRSIDGRSFDGRSLGGGSVATGRGTAGGGWRAGVVKEVDKRSEVSTLISSIFSVFKGACTLRIRECMPVCVCGVLGVCVICVGRCLCVSKMCCVLCF